MLLVHQWGLHDLLKKKKKSILRYGLVRLPKLFYSVNVTYEILSAKIFFNCSLVWVYSFKSKPKDDRPYFLSFRKLFRPKKRILSKKKLFCLFKKKNVYTLPNKITPNILQLFILSRGFPALKILMKISHQRFIWSFNVIIPAVLQYRYPLMLL